MRRVEALVGVDAYHFLAREHTLVAQLTELAQGAPGGAAGAGRRLTSRLRDAEKEIEKLRAEQVLAGAAALAADPTDVFGVGVVRTAAPDGTTADDLRRLVLDVRGRIPAERPAVVALVTVGERPAGDRRRDQRDGPRAGPQGR